MTQFFRAFLLTLLCLFVLSISKLVFLGVYDTTVGNAIVRTAAYLFAIWLAAKFLDVRITSAYFLDLQGSQIMVVILIALPSFLFGWILVEAETFLRSGSDIYFSNSEEIFSLDYRMKFFLTSFDSQPYSRRGFF